MSENETYADNCFHIRPLQLWWNMITDDDMTEKQYCLKMVAICWMSELKICYRAKSAYFHYGKFKFVSAKVNTVVELF